MRRRSAYILLYMPISHCSPRRGHFGAVTCPGIAEVMFPERRFGPISEWYPWSTVLVLLASTMFLLGSVIADLKHSLLTAILILLSFVVSIIIVREKGDDLA